MAKIQDFGNLVHDALEVVEFKLIRDRADMENNELVFHPTMAHQIFGDAETIFGYQNLRVRILYTAGPLHIYLGIEYTNRVDDISKGDIKADNVVATIASNLPDGCYFINLDEFLKTLDKADKFVPFGEKLAEFKKANDDGTERLFEIYQCDFKSSAFLKFFARLQTFVLWFIDAATYTDLDDPQWDYFVVYEKYKNKNGSFSYATLGFTTVYKYYAYPQHVRPRIAQMLILPPFQRLGIGQFMLASIYNYFSSQKNIVDITVEDPSDAFQSIRNLVDTRLCMRLKSFQRDEIKKGYNKEMEREARENFKIHPIQVRRVYEILRLYNTNINDENDYKEYRLEVKRRLSVKWHKQLQDIKKLEKMKYDTEWMKKCLPSAEARREKLHEEFKRVEKEYMQIVKKLRV